MLAAKVTAPAPRPQPAGKLGLLVDHISIKVGATVDELAAATGWQRHSVLGALSRLKSRGYEMRLETLAGRKAYRMASSSGR